MAESPKKLRRYSKWWIVPGAASTLIIYLYFDLYPPFPRPPKIGRHLPSEFSEANLVFLERVKRNFPDLSNEADMIHELDDQGFKVNSITKEAYFLKSSFPCRLQWRISWLSESGLITKIDASYGGACL